MDIKVLGPGCKKCRALEKAVRQAAAEAGARATIQKVEGMDEIAAYNVLLTPALVINGKVKVSGRVPKLKDITGFIRAEM